MQLPTGYSDFQKIIDGEFDFVDKSLLIKEEASVDIKEWYNGYRIGDHTLYNPWSIINCLHNGGALKPYWVNTSDNALIKTLLLKSSGSFKERFELLLEGDSVERLIDENFVYSDLAKNNESAVWSLLLMTGYLKIDSSQERDQGTMCFLKIPNREIRNLYRGIRFASGYLCS